MNLWLKVKDIAEGPNADLLRKLVDVLYEQAERGMSMTKSPCPPKTWLRYEKADEALRRGDKVISVLWKIMKRTRGL